MTKLQSVSRAYEFIDRILFNRQSELIPIKNMVAIVN